MEEPVQYCALSYCWGPSSKSGLKATKANLPTLLQRNALVGLKHEVPGTIRDAIKFTAAMGLRYLWVDALCICQDDKSQKAKQIGQMDRIYSNAELTIVAAAGSDAWHGLPGLRSGSRTVTGSFLTRDIGLVTLSTVPSSGADHGLIAQSTWAQRAWTLQEYLLSPRLLIFTDKELFWECKSRNRWRESMCLECPGMDVKVLDLDDVSIYKPPDYFGSYQRYFSLMEQVSDRLITYESDRLPCVQGLLNSMSTGFAGDFLWGMPLARLAAALVFTHQMELGPPRQTTFQARLTPPAPVQRNKHFPSWCWAGWNRQAYNTTEDYRDPDTVSRHGAAIANLSTTNIFQDVAWHKICNSGKDWQLIPPIEVDEKESALYHESLAKWNASVSSEVSEEVTARFKQASIPLTHALGCWAQTARLPVGKDSSLTKHEEQRLKQFDIMDPTGTVIECVEMRRDRRISLPYKIDFMLLSHRRMHVFDRPHSDRVFADLLLVEQKAGVTFRIDSPKLRNIELDMWKSYDPEWQFVVMA